MVVFDASGLVGDINNDGNVDFRDLIFLVSHFDVDNSGNTPDPIYDTIHNNNFVGGVSYLAKYIIGEVSELSTTFITIRQIDNVTEYKIEDTSPFNLSATKLIFEDNIVQNNIVIPPNWKSSIHNNQIILYSSVGHALNSTEWSTLLIQDNINTIKVDASGLEFVNDFCSFIPNIGVFLNNGYIEPEPEPEPEPQPEPEPEPEPQPEPEPEIFNIFLDKNDLQTAVYEWATMNNDEVLAKYGPINEWDVSAINDMSNLFYDTSGTYSSFNEDISNWDVSEVTNMENMFANAENFNIPLNSWNVAKVTSMFGMFNCTDDVSGGQFNQDIGNWNVSIVQNMASMFRNQRFFNKPLNSWDVSKVSNMQWMFDNAEAFNQNINDWNVSSVTNMYGVFRSATVFNQPLNKWDVSSVTKMQAMFAYAHAFNQPIANGFGTIHSDIDFGIMAFPNSDSDAHRNGYDIHQYAIDIDHNLILTMILMDSTYTRFVKVTETGVVLDSTKYRHNDGGGNITYSTAQELINAYNNAKESDAYYEFRKGEDFTNGIWDVSSVTNMINMFYFAENFNQPLDSWDVSSVTSMTSMFYQAENFNQPLNSWNVLNVMDQKGVFSHAKKFNQPLNNWNVFNVTNMTNMFWNAESFDQNIADWDISNVNSTTNFAKGTNISTNNYSSILVGWEKLATLSLDVSGNSIVFSSKYNEEGWVARTKLLSRLDDNFTWDDEGFDVSGESLITSHGESENGPYSNGPLVFNISGVETIDIPIKIGNSWKVGDYEETYVKVETTDNEPVITGFYGENDSISNLDTSSAYIVQIYLPTPDLNDSDETWGVYFYEKNITSNSSLNITEFNGIVLYSNSNQFQGFAGTISATDAPSIRTGTSLDFAFKHSTFQGHRDNEITLNLSNWNVSGITTTKQMFNDTPHLGNNFDVIIENWDLNNSDSCEQMFHKSFGYELDNYNHKTISLKGWNLTNYLYEMFFESPYFDGELNNWTITDPTSMQGMFHDCVNFKGNGLSSWIVMSPQGLEYSMYKMFRSCLSLGNEQDIDISQSSHIFSYDATGTDFNGSNVIDLSSQFDVDSAGILGNASRTIVATIKTTSTDSNNTQFICSYGEWGIDNKAFGIRLRNGTDGHGISFGGNNYDKYALGLCGYSNDFYSNFQITTDVETTIAVSYNSHNNTTYFFKKEENVTVNVTDITHPDTGSDGQYFYFDLNEWNAAFGNVQAGDSSTFINQYRNGVLIKSDSVFTWDNNNGVHGRFTNNAVGDWQIGDIITNPNHNSATWTMDVVFDRFQDGVTDSLNTTLGEGFMIGGFPKAGSEDPFIGTIGQVKVYDYAVTSIENIEDLPGSWDYTYCSTMELAFRNTPNLGNNSEFKMNNCNLVNLKNISNDSEEEGSGQLFQTFFDSFGLCTGCIPSVNGYTNTNTELKNWNIAPYDLSGDWGISLCDMFGTSENTGRESYFNGDVSNWTITDPTNMTSMFHDCEKFKGKGLSSWIVKSPKGLGYSMKKMFRSCINLGNEQDIDISQFRFRLDQLDQHIISYDATGMNIPIDLSSYFNTSTIGITGNKDRTIIVVINWTGTTVDKNILSYGNTSAYTGSAFSLRVNDGGILRLWINNTSIYSTITVSPNVETIVGVSVDNKKEIHFYIKGVSEQEWQHEQVNSSHDLNTHTDNNFTLGDAWGGNHFGGTIGGVAIYDFAVTSIENLEDLVASDGSWDYTYVNNSEECFRNCQYLGSGDSVFIMNDCNFQNNEELAQMFHDSFQNPGSSGNDANVYMNNWTIGTNYSNADSYYVSTVLPGSKIESIPMVMELGYSNDWTIEWEHMDTLTYITGGATYPDDASDIFIGNGTNGRFFVRSWDGKYYVALENSFELISLNTTDYVPNKRNKVRIVYSSGYYYYIINGVTQSAQSIGDWGTRSVTSIHLNRNHEDSDDSYTHTTNTMYAFRYWDSVNNQNGNGINLNNMFSESLYFNANISDWNINYVRYFGGLVKNSQRFNQNLGNWTIFNSAVPWSDGNNSLQLNDMFLGSGMSVENYSNTLYGWSLQDSYGHAFSSDAVTIANTQYNYLGYDAHIELKRKVGLTINDGGFYESNIHFETLTNKFFGKDDGNDNLKYIGQMGGISVNDDVPIPLKYWAVDPYDNNIIVAAIDDIYLKMVKITQNGDTPTNVDDPIRYVVSDTTSISSQSDLINAYNIGTVYDNYTFIKSPYFDLYTTKYLSISDNKTVLSRNTSLAIYPPSNHYLAFGTNDPLKSSTISINSIDSGIPTLQEGGFVRFRIDESGTIDGDADLEFYVGICNQPAKNWLNSDSLNKFRYLQLRADGTSICNLMEVQAWVGNVNIAANRSYVLEPQTKLISNAGSGGYSCSASSVNENSTTAQPYEPFMAFNGTAGSPTSDIWGTSIGVYDADNDGTYNGDKTLDTTSGAVSGEYIILDMPHGVKLSAVKLAGQHTTSPPLPNAPKDWSVYGKNSGSWELIQEFTNSVPGTVFSTFPFSTFPLNTPSTVEYQSFAILISTSNGSDNVAISEIEFVSVEGAAPAIWIDYEEDLSQEDMSFYYSSKYHYASLANNNLMGTEPSVHDNYPFAHSTEGTSNLDISMLIDLQNDYNVSDLQAIVVYNRQDDGGSSAKRIEGFRPQLLDSNMNIVYDGNSFTGGNDYHRVNGPAWWTVSSSLLTDSETDFATKIINRNDASDDWNNTTVYEFSAASYVPDSAGYPNTGNFWKNNPFGTSNGGIGQRTNNATNASNIHQWALDYDGNVILTDRSLDFEDQSSSGDPCTRFIKITQTGILVLLEDSGGTLRNGKDIGAYDITYSSRENLINAFHNDAVFSTANYSFVKDYLFYETTMNLEYIFTNPNFEVFALNDGNSNFHGRIIQSQNIVFDILSTSSVQKNGVNTDLYSVSTWKYFTILSIEPTDTSEYIIEWEDDPVSAQHGGYFLNHGPDQNGGTGISDTNLRSQVLWHWYDDPQTPNKGWFAANSNEYVFYNGRSTADESTVAVYDKFRTKHTMKFKIYDNTNWQMTYVIDGSDVSFIIPTIKDSGGNNFTINDKDSIQLRYYFYSSSTYTSPHKITVNNSQEKLRKTTDDPTYPLFNSDIKLSWSDDAIQYEYQLGQEVKTITKQIQSNISNEKYLFGFLKNRFSNASIQVYGGLIDYNLFTVYLFGTDLLGEISHIGGISSLPSENVEYWAYDSSDDSVILGATTTPNHFRMIKIDLQGNNISRGVYSTEGYDFDSWTPTINSGQDLINYYNNGILPSSPLCYTFTKNTLFDMIVNTPPTSLPLTSMLRDSTPADGIDVSVPYNNEVTHTFEPGELIYPVTNKNVHIDPKKDMVASCVTVLPADTPTTGVLWEIGGTGWGSFLGIIQDNSGNKYIRYRAGRGTDVGEAGAEISVAGIALLDIPISNISTFFDGSEHEITWEIRIGGNENSGRGRVKLWIDGKEIGYAETPDSDTGEITAIGASGGNVFSGSNDGGFCKAYGDSVAGGITLSDWAYTTSDMSYYKARLVDPNYSWYRESH
jgi:surface protein